MLLWGDPLTRNNDLGWLLMVVAVVATAVSSTPFEVPAPLRLVPKCPRKDYIPTAVPDTFSFYCTGSRDSRAYEHTKFRASRETR